MSDSLNPPHVDVKPYRETIYEALCCCWPGARHRQPKTEYERLLEQEEEDLDEEIEATTPVLRWIALILSGHFLPDNLQLYAALHRCSGVLEGLRHAQQPTPASTHDDGSAPSPLLGETTAELLTTLAALCRDVARWLTSTDVMISPVTTTPDGTPQKEQRIPNGNSRHQLQRIVFSICRLVNNKAVPVSFEGSLSDMAVPNIATVQHSVEQLAEDIRLTVYSLFQIGIIAVTSDQLTNAMRDALNFVRDLAADVALEAAQESAMVESVLRPSEQERQGTLRSELEGVGSAAQMVAASAAQVDPAALAEKVQSLPRDGAEWAKSHVIGGQELGQRIADAAGQLMDDDDSFRDAVQNIVRLVTKYLEATKTAAQGKLSEDTLDSLTASSNRKTPSISMDPAVHDLLRAFQELVEGLAGGKSLDPILSECWKLWAIVKVDIVEALDNWAHDVQQQLSQGQQTRYTGCSQHQTFSATFRSLYDKLFAIIAERPDLQAHWKRICSLTSAFFGEIQREPRCITIKSRLVTVYDILVKVFDQQHLSLTLQGYELLRDMYSQVLPFLFRLMGKIPLPRIEFTSPQVDAALDDLQIGAINLIPGRLRFEAKEVFEWNRIDRNKNTASLQEIRLEVQGLRLAVRQASFFFREKVTQVRFNWLNYVCCAFPPPEDQMTISGQEQEGHLGAYREQALLDLGLFGRSESLQGADVTIDLTRSRQDEDVKSFLEVKATTVSLSDSFALRLRRSHHYLVNALVIEPLVAPIVRIVLEHVGAVLIERAVQTLDERIYDFHLRARTLAQQSGGRDHPGPPEYMRVLLDAKAGKSKERLRKEEDAREEEEKANRDRQAQQEEEERAENAVDPVSKPKVEVKPMAIVINPTNDISISVGAYPSLLPLSAQGPETQRTRLRNAVVQDEWRGAIRNRAVETWTEIVHAGSAAMDAANAAGSAAVQVKSEIDQTFGLATRLEHVAEEREDIEEARLEDDPGKHGGAEQLWRHQGFDL